MSRNEEEGGLSIGMGGWGGEASRLGIADGLEAL